jgi:gliding motility-associated transport system ATP-binding protein
MIYVDKLTKYFGAVMAVDRISFQVDKGEIVGFLGPNGAGKTTTMRILTTFLPATSGIARVAGYDVMTQSIDVRRNIGYLPESVPMYPEMRVEEYLDFRAKLKGVPRSGRLARLDFCLERARLREVRRRLIGTLSRGYRQRVGLADAMINDPPILIMDEPTAGLDPLQIRETLALIKELGQEHTILLSTHILSEVEAICERVIIINAGRVGLSQDLDELEAQAVILMEVKGPADAVRNALRDVKDVIQVNNLGTDDGFAGFEIKTRDNKDLREDLSKAMNDKEWLVRRIDLRHRRLEDAFFDVLREEDPLKDVARTGAASSEAIKK